MAVLFTASWCSPCTELKQWLKDKNFDKYITEYVDIDEDIKRAKEANISKLPTLIFGDGERITGRETIKPYVEAQNATS